MDDDGVQDSGGEEPLRFIRDEAADEDFFGSHKRLAEAIATVIRSKSELKVVGLLGAWGSGKSTVIKLLRKELSTNPDGVETLCFTYDAWLAQSDPQRRSFLETLIRFLIGHKLTDEERWNTRLAQLNRQVEETETTVTPTLTKSGRWVILSLFLLPLAMQFVGYDWFKDVFSKTPSSFAAWAVGLGAAGLLLPAAVAIWFYVAWRPTLWPFNKHFFTRANWTRHDAAHEEESILSLFMNKEVQRQKHRVTRTPDPTTIEFQEIFREVMEEVTQADRRFIFVIDNLDRLPETEAVAMWGTVRSFFLGAGGSHRATSASLPIVILPIDEDAIRRMYAVSHGDDAPGLASSFMDKTFDLTFRVTRPVLSHWRAYLDQQMKLVFGPSISQEWVYVTGRFYEEFLANRVNGGVTPREINTLLNQIGTLWLQWKAMGVPFASVAYYAIFRPADSDVLSVASVPRGGIDQLDPNWQRSFAAIHYGVAALDDALQVLIEQPLRNAIAANDAPALKKLVENVHGYENVLQRIFDQLAVSPAPDPAFLANAATLFDELDPTPGVWVSMAWRTLRSVFLRAGAPAKFGTHEVEAFKALLAYCEPGELPSFVRQSVGWLASFNSATLGPPAGSAAFATSFEALLEVAGPEGIDVPALAVPGSAADFLQIVAQKPTDAAFLGHLETKTPPADLVQELANNLVDQAMAASVESKVRALILRDKKLPWDVLVASAGQVIQSQTATYPGMAPALASLGLLRLKEKSAGAQIKQLADSEMLFNRMNEAHNASKQEIEASCIALLVLTKPVFPTPGAVTWDKVLANRAQLAALTDNALTDFDTPDNFEAMVKACEASPDLLLLTRAVLSRRVRDGRMGRLHVEQVIAGLPQHLNCVDEDVRELLIQRLSHYQTFWEKLQATPFGDNLFQILHALLADEKRDEDQVAGAIKERLDAATAEQWIASYQTDAEPLPIAAAVADQTGKRLEIAGSQLFDALNRSIPEFLSDADKDKRGRWFELASFLKRTSRKTLFKYVRDQILAGGTVADLRGLLNADDKSLLEHGEFASKADGAVLHVVLPMLGTAEGIEWLDAESNRVKPWVERSPEATRSFLADRLSDLGSGADDAQKSKLELLRTQWGLPELSEDPPSEEAEPVAEDEEPAPT